MSFLIKYDVLGAPMVNTAIHTGAEACDESDNLSDIDDVEVPIHQPKCVDIFFNL